MAFEFVDWTINTLGVPGALGTFFVGLVIFGWWWTK